ncbi:MAG: hypothetical protein AAF620_18765 [Bacteroidota bacterium]
MNSFIYTPTPNLAKSKSFFQQLNFQELPAEKGAYFSDGRCIIEINENRSTRPGIKIYKDSWKEMHDKKVLGSFHSIEGGQVLADPNGVWVYLMEGESPIPTDITQYPLSTLGNYMGVSLEAVNFEGTRTFWEALGFSIHMGTPEQGWIVLMHPSGVGISLMKAGSCPHMFINPSLTYFNGKNNPGIIEKVRKTDVLIYEEVTAFSEKGEVDNIILREPGGYGFFVFND